MCICHVKYGAEEEEQTDSHIWDHPFFLFFSPKNIRFFGASVKFSFSLLSYNSLLSCLREKSLLLGSIFSSRFFLRWLFARQEQQPMTEGRSCSEGASTVATLQLGNQLVYQENLARTWQYTTKEPDQHTTNAMRGGGECHQ